MNAPRSMGKVAAIQGPPESNSAGAALRLLVFSLAEQSYALALDEISEIVPMAELSRPPGAPHMLAGFLNLGGQPVPVLRLRGLFGLEDCPPALFTPLIVLKRIDNRIALIADGVSEIISMTTEDILPAPANGSFNDCTAGFIRQNDRVVLLLAPERILLEKERQALAEFEAMEQERLCALETTEP